MVQMRVNAAGQKAGGPSNQPTDTECQVWRAKGIEPYLALEVNLVQRAPGQDRL